MRLLLASILSVIVFVDLGTGCLAEEFLLVDQSAWPGKLLATRGENIESLWQRGASVDQRDVPKIQSLTILPDGGLAFCSGLDRSVILLRNGRESQLHHGGSLVRQVRTDINGDLYWSGLETPIDSNPIPDGYIHRRSHETGQVETLITFSQELVGKDWWGALDVRGEVVFVATLKSPARLYRLENSIPKLIANLPIAVSAFRFESDNAILATDGTGKIYRFSDLSHPAEFQVVWSGQQRFVDFAKRPESSGF